MESMLNLPQKPKEDPTMTPYERVNDYLDYCRYRKELDYKTLKAYRIDLRLPGSGQAKDRGVYYRSA